MKYIKGQLKIIYPTCSILFPEFSRKFSTGAVYYCSMYKHSEVFFTDLD
jgi:hypothetical protein